MDISTLNSHYERLQQLSKNEGTLDGLKSGAANCTGLFATEIAELEAQIEQEKAVIAESEEIIAAWISGIEDGTTRTISTQNRRSATMSLTAPRRASEAPRHSENPCSIQTRRAASCKWLKTNRCPLP